MTGRIVRIMSGQGQGYIRLEDGRDVFFDRRDSISELLCHVVGSAATRQQIDRECIPEAVLPLRP